MGHKPDCTPKGKGEGQESQKGHTHRGHELRSTPPQRGTGVTSLHSPEPRNNPMASDTAQTQTQAKPSFTRNMQNKNRVITNRKNHGDKI